MRKVQALYHYTCQHGHSDIVKSGILLPHTHPFMKALGPLLWLTDLVEPTPESVGLTSSWTSCNRLEFRYIVTCKAAVHWFDIRGHAPRWIVADLESSGQPEHWWVVRRPVTPSEFHIDTLYQ